MIHSMTGFARIEASGDWGELSWELRSVNHRYLDVSLRLPEPLRAIEPQVRARATDTLGRGKLECTLRYNAEAAATGLELDRDKLAALAAACREAADSFDDAGPVDPLRALQWPGVVRQSAPDDQALAKAALTALDDALTALQANRAEEGARLDDFLRGHLRAIGDKAAAIQQRLPDVRHQWRERLEAKLAELEQPVDPGRLEQEAVIAATKADVEEELSRLRMHVDAFAEALDAREPVGRRLDFLMQEFNRETNTLSSKSQDAEMRQQAVDIKVLVEQMREQVQNVE